MKIQIDPSSEQTREGHGCDHSTVKGNGLPNSSVLGVSETTNKLPCGIFGTATQDMYHPTGHI